MVPVYKPPYLPPPNVIAQEIVEDLEAALKPFRLIATGLAEQSAAKSE